jgi:anti-sigma B factor antagonist
MTSAAFALNLTTTDTTGTAETVAVTGEIDVTNASQLITSIDGVAGRRPLIVDLSGLRYLDSAGFAALFQMLGRHTIVAVVDPNSPVRAAANLTGLPCHDSIDAAIASQPS